ncbi:MAG: carbamate kinase [Lachnospiraceae bacterium]
MRTYVIAIGGNALEENKDGLDSILQQISNCIADLIKEGNRLVLVHGNGPQIGNIVVQNQMAHGVIEENTIDECGAMTQAMIGYTLQKEIGNSLRKKGIRKDVVTVLTQVVVDEQEALNIEPSKPIGQFYTKEEAMCRMQTEGFPYMEDAGRGYRRVVRSPMPKRIEEIGVIRELLEVGSIVIAGGGGGIPVIEKEGGLCGVEAVIDKDFTAELLAGEIDADTLILLTGVEYAAINFGTPEQKNLEIVHLPELEKYIEEGQFSKGSMLPKVQACIRFVKDGENRQAIIGTLSKLHEIIIGKGGTVVVR